MKRLLPILALLCVAAGGQEARWEEALGKWSRSDGILQTDNGILICENENAQRFSLSCDFLVHEWTEERSFLAIFWAFEGSRPDEANWEKRQELILRESTIAISGLKSVAIRLPKNKSIPVRIVSKSGYTEVRVGKIKMSSHARYDSPSKLALIISRMDAEVRNLEVCWR